MVSRVLPRVLYFLRTFRGDCKLLKEHLPRLVEHHVAKFTVPATVAPQAAGSYSYTNRQGVSSSGATGASKPLYASAWMRGNTYLLFRRILESSLHNLIPVMLQKILSISLSPPRFKKPEDQLKFYIEILTVIKNELSAFKISAESLPAIPHFFQGFILRYILPALGARPPSGRSNYTIPPLPCLGDVSCGRHCRLVSDFLRSSAENMKTWTMSQAERAHIMTSIHWHYSHNHHLVSEGKPPKKGIYGSLTLRKSGLSSSERFLAWESRRETIERDLGPLSEFFAKGEWGDTIFATMMKTGPGFTAHTEYTAWEWLGKPFPESTDAETSAGDPTVDAAAAAAATLEGSPDLIPLKARPAFLGYAHIDPWGVSFDHPRLRREDSGLRDGQVKDYSQDTPSQTLLARRDPRNAIRISIDREKLESRVIHMPVKELADAAAVPWYWNIPRDRPEDPKFQVFEDQGKSKVTELRDYLYKHQEKITRDWWIAEIYDSKVLDGIPGVYEKLAESVPQVPLPPLAAPEAPNAKSVPVPAVATPTDPNLEVRTQSGRKRGMSESGDALAANGEAPKKQKRAVEIIDLDSDDEE
jgi:hypothetical protein